VWVGEGGAFGFIKLDTSHANKTAFAVNIKRCGNTFEVPAIKRKSHGTQGKAV